MRRIFDRVAEFLELVANCISPGEVALFAGLLPLQYESFGLGVVRLLGRCEHAEDGIETLHRRRHLVGVAPLAVAGDAGSGRVAGALVVIVAVDARDARLVHESAELLHRDGYFVKPRRSPSFTT